MYTVRYGYSTAQLVLSVLEVAEIDWMEERTWHPIQYLISVFILSFALMPIFLFSVLMYDRADKIKDATGAILEKYYDFEKDE